MKTSNSDIGTLMLSCAKDKNLVVMIGEVATVKVYIEDGQLKMVVKSPKCIKIKKIQSDVMEFVDKIYEE